VAAGTADGVVEQATDQEIAVTKFVAAKQTEKEPKTHATDLSTYKSFFALRFLNSSNGPTIRIGLGNLQGEEQRRASGASARSRDRSMQASRSIERARASPAPAIMLKR
jgi:hypothetical protein